MQDYGYLKNNYRLKEEQKMKKLVFYRCEICGNLVVMINDSGVTPTCCGGYMTEITENTEDAVVEKHVPVFKRKADTVQISVGSTDHPMVSEHYIEWVIVHTENGVYARKFSPSDMPHAEFRIPKDEHILNIYAYCNIHGLWSVNTEEI